MTDLQESLAYLREVSGVIGRGHVDRLEKALEARYQPPAAVAGVVTEARQLLQNARPTGNGSEHVVSGRTLDELDVALRALETAEDAT